MSRLQGMVISISTFMFADLCGYTEYTWQHGDERSAELATGFHALVRDAASARASEFVKAVGDAAMVRSAECSDAIGVADRILTACAERGYPQVRIGIDTGPATHCEGDWYGTTVNTAARIAEQAAPGQVLLTERALGSVVPMAIEAVACGNRRLKGLPDCILHAARPRAAELCP